MTLQEIKELMQTMADTDVTSLDWNSCGGTLHLERQSRQQNKTISDSVKSAADDKSTVTADQTDTNEKTLQLKTEENVFADPETITVDKPGELVKSPVVGIYYSSPSPDSDPFVSQGSRIEKGNPLCIIEAMKLMNEVNSPCSGEVAEILVENGQRVEYGQVLFRIV